MRASTLWSLTRQAAVTWRALIASAPAETPARFARIRELYDGFRPAFAQVSVVESAALQRALATGERVSLIDVRSASERAVSTLPGAVSVDEFLAQADAQRDRRVIAFCTLGVRSGAWAAERCAEGLSVENLSGGLLAWTHAHGALVTPAGAPTRQLHVYTSWWNLPHHDYEGVW